MEVLQCFDGDIHRNHDLYEHVRDTKNKVEGPMAPFLLDEHALGLCEARGRDIQDEKVRGAVHVATGRSDHLGGHLVPSMFSEKSHATHDDILFAPHKTPEILVKQVRMKRGDQNEVLIENYEPSAYLDSLVA